MWRRCDLDLAFLGIFWSSLPGGSAPRSCGLCASDVCRLLGKCCRIRGSVAFPVNLIVCLIGFHVGCLGGRYHRFWSLTAWVVLLTGCKEEAGVTQMCFCLRTTTFSPSRSLRFSLSVQRNVLVQW